MFTMMSITIRSLWGSTWGRLWYLRRGIVFTSSPVCVFARLRLVQALFFVFARLPPLSLCAFSMLLLIVRHWIGFSWCLANLIGFAIVDGNGQLHRVGRGHKLYVPPPPQGPRGT